MESSEKYLAARKFKDISQNLAICETGNPLLGFLSTTNRCKLIMYVAEWVFKCEIGKWRWQLAEFKLQQSIDLLKLELIID